MYGGSHARRFLTASDAADAGRTQPFRLDFAAMQITDFDYELPPELVASEPTTQRVGSRLMRVAGSDQPLEHAHFSDLPRWFAPGDVLVLNNTQVIPARVQAHKATGGKVEILLERAIAQDECLVHIRANRSPQAGAELLLPGGVQAIVLAREGEYFRLRLTVPVLEYFDANGEVPLPPYLGRAAAPADRERYQTVYATEVGAVAAPTAGLHFDDRLLEKLRRAGVVIVELTLHVGAGTFQNLRAEQLERGKLHAERLHVDQTVVDAIVGAQQQGHRVTAVGTTSTRALEEAAKDGNLRAINGQTELFIRPGFDFKVVDRLITNYHLPGSSLLMLLGAFMGVAAMQAAYREAIAQRYRFFSYGDAMFVDRRDLHAV